MDISQKRLKIPKPDFHKTNYGSFEDSFVPACTPTKDPVRSDILIRRSNSVCSLLENVNSSSSIENIFERSIEVSKPFCNSYNNIEYHDETKPNTSNFYNSGSSSSSKSNVSEEIDLNTSFFNNIVQNTNALNINNEIQSHLDSLEYRRIVSSDDDDNFISSDLFPSVNATVINESSHNLSVECKNNNLHHIETETLPKSILSKKECINKKSHTNSSSSTKPHSLRNQNNKALAIANQNNKLISLSLSIMLAALLQVVRCLTVMLDDTLSCFKHDMF